MPKWPIAICLSLLFLFVIFRPLAAFDRSNISLKNWGGFSVHRSWVYDALEKIVLAGLAERALLNSKPLTRVEAARIVAQAVRRLTKDQYGDYNHRGYLEELVYRLVEEFGPELSEMDVKTPLNRGATPGLWTMYPVDHAQFDGVYADRSRKIINNFGSSVYKGMNPHAAFDGRVQVGDILSFYYRPELYRTRDSAQGKLIGGYGKLTLWNTELEVGRDSLWWGPGYRGSMTFSNNGFPLDQVKLSTAEPVKLPWLLKYLGPVKFNLLVAQLDEDRDLPHAKVGGWRINLAPSRYVEVGFSRLFQFGGKGRPSMEPWRFLQLLVDQGSDDPDSALNVNNLMSLDLNVRIPDIERYILIARDVSLYGELGWDDTQDPGFRFLFLPTGAIIPRKPGGIVGMFLTGVLGDPKLDLRLEYAKTTDIQFTHSRYTSGFTNRDSVLSHFIGTDGSEMFARVSRWINPDLLLGFQISRAEIGPTEGVLSAAPREKRDGFGFDVSYRVSEQSSIFLGYEFAHVKDRDHVAGKSGNDNLFRVEFSRSFGR